MLRILVTGGPPVRNGGGIPQRNAVAQFVGGPNGVTASNCEGRSVELELELRVRLVVDIVSLFLV